MNRVKFIEINSELGAGTRGASLGPDSLKIAALNNQNPIFRDSDYTIIGDNNISLIEPFKDSSAKYIDGIFDIYKEVLPITKDAVEKGNFPIFLIGDHSNSGATISSIKLAHPDKRIGVVWIDAHADIHTPYTTPSGNVHGMPLAVLLAEDNLKENINEPSEQTKAIWEAMKSFGGIEPKVSSEDLIYVALRSFEKPEESLIKEKGINVLTVAHIEESGSKKIADEIAQLLKNCDLIHVSFDVDSLDADIAFGTGTPVSGGLSFEMGKSLILKLLANPKICSMDIAEINPLLDNKNQLGEKAYTILKEVVELKNSN